MPDLHKYDVLIAGQGAAGYAAALYAARYTMQTLLVGPQFGGETALAGVIENYPGIADIPGFDLMSCFRTQVEKYDVPIFDEAVVMLNRRSDCFEAGLSNGAEVRAGAVILAVGRERRRLGLAHEEDWTGRGVSFCSTCDAPLYRGKRVAVVGGGNSAVEGALLNTKYAASVHLIYRGARFWRPDSISLDLLSQSSVQVLFQTEVLELLGDRDAGLTGVRLSSPHAGTDTLPLDGLFIEIGSDPRTDLVRANGVELTGEPGEIHVDHMMRTNVPGLFAAGDVTDGSGPLKQTVTAAAQGAIAALSAYQFLSSPGGRCTKHERGYGLKG